MTKQTFILVHETARKRALAAVTTAPDGFVTVICEPTKKRIQEEKYHAMIGDIARTCQLRKLPAESWKRLLVEQFVQELRDEAKAQGKPDPFPRDGCLLPSLDGLRIVQVEVLTRNFTVSQASKFIEYLYSFGAESGVDWEMDRVTQ